MKKNMIKKFMAKTLLMVMLSTTGLNMTVQAEELPVGIVETVEDDAQAEETASETEESVETAEVEEQENVEATEEAAETEEEGTETDTEDSEEASDVEATEETEATETEEATEAEETEEEAEESAVDLGDLLGSVDNTTNTDSVVYAELNIEIPANTIISKDGQTLTSYEADVLLTDGLLVLSQPTSLEYKNRFEGEILVTIENGVVSVSYNGSQVQGSVFDELGNEISFDGKTLRVVNSDKMEDLTPEEPDEDEPEQPTEGPADYTVRYYRDALQEGNFLGEYQVGGVAGNGIDYSAINVNLYQPESYGNGEIQTVVSAQVITEDDSDIVYILYTRVEKEIEIVETTIEVPVEKIITVEVPIEKEVIVEKEVEVPVYVDRVVEVPGETIYVEVPVEKIVEVPVEVPGETVYVEVPVEVIKEVEKIVEKEIVKEVKVPGETVYVETPVEVEKIVEKEVPVIVEVPVTEIVTETVFVPVEVEKIVEVEKEVTVDRIVEIPGETKVVYVEVPTTEIKEVEVIVEKEVPVYIEVPSENNETIVTPEENSDPAPEYDEDDAPEYTDGPQTGDAAPITILVVLMVVSLLGMAMMTRKTTK